MNKQEWLQALRSSLRGIPQEEAEKSIAFYDEMISDRMEDGMTEAEAVAAIGSVEEITAKIVSDTPLTKIVKENIKPRHALRGWEIALLILGSPVWLPLLVAAVCVVLAVYVVLWAVILCLYAIDLSVAASGIASLAAACFYLTSGKLPASAAALGLAFLCAGLTIFLFLGFGQVAKGLLFLSKKPLLTLKARLIRKGDAQ